MTIIMSCCMWQLASLLCVCCLLAALDLEICARLEKYLVDTNGAAPIARSFACETQAEAEAEAEKWKCKLYKCFCLLPPRNPRQPVFTSRSCNIFAISGIFLIFMWTIFSRTCKLQIANVIHAAWVNYVNGSGVISLAPLCTLSLSPYPSPSPRNWHFNCRRCQDQLTLYVVSSCHPFGSPALIDVIRHLRRVPRTTIFHS